jgi:hypothetical protein
MKTNSEFSLIDGKFTAEQAEQVLIALVNYKIDFHNRQDFSNHIRFNDSLEHSKKRVNQLQETKINMQEFLKSIKLSDTNLVIKSTITVSIED